MFWEVHPDGARWSVRLTTAGRVLGGAHWALKAFPVALVAAALFFGIDWIGRIATGVPVPAGFVLTVVAFAGFIAFGAFVARLLRYRQWIIDRDARTVSLVLRRAFGEPQVHDVSFDEIERVELRGAAVGAKTIVILVFEDGTEELFVSTRLGVAAFEPLLIGLRRAFDDTGLSVDVA